MWYSIHVWWEFSLTYNVVWERNRSSHPKVFQRLFFWRSCTLDACNFIKKEAMIRYFPVNFANTFFYRTLPVAGSEESVILTHFIPLVSFYTSWKHQKTFLMFLESQNESSSTTWVNQRNMKNVARNTEKYWNTFLSRITL